ncbi:ATP-binding protein [Streptomyces sp. NBC_01255]|uniref:ATP-binding protein n=1 Tax=Streptomyces sp. NBC_01255 TaxID=2903798 RepID=UPI002E376737|nr:ATP-binding protein [Streptomyces sp. NBC_01255]
MNEALPPALLAALADGAAGEAGRLLVDELARALAQDPCASAGVLAEAAAQPDRQEAVRAWGGRVADLLVADPHLPHAVGEAMQRHSPGSVGTWYRGDHIDFRGSVFLGDVVGTQVVIQQNGNAGPGPWMKPADYLRQVNKGSVYTHRWRLVGRTQTIESLVPFARNGQGDIALLVGRGGVGKTKIVTALCESLRDAEPALEVRVLGTDSDISSGVFRELPSEGSLLVIVDDAHNDALPLERIVSGVRNANRSANVLLCLRPYGMAHVRRALGRAGTHVSDATLVEIGDLEFDDAVSLAGEILNEEVRLHAPRLAASARDCPLLIVTGAALINSGELDPRRFEGDEQLHLELTDRLAEALTTNPAAGQVPRELLPALAAFQPVRLAEPEVQSSLAALTGLPFDISAQHLETLEQAGVILRHGTTVRLVPDLLGDALLVKAARHSSTGLPTGYLAKAMEAGQGSALANLVVNTGRVEWQHRQDIDSGGLIEPLWEGITAAFRSADARGRVSLLEIVAKVAFFQPRRAIDLTTWAVDNPCGPATADVGFGLTHTWTNTDVRYALVAVLQAAARSLEALPQAASLLWRLGRDDQRPLHQNPSHPLRVLEELASYTRWGPTKYQQVLVSQVERWLTRSPDTPYVHQPLSVLTPLLAAEGHDELWAPATWALTFRPYVMAPTSEVLDMRGLVLDLAFEELRHPQLERASAAHSLIGNAFRLPHGSFGLSVTDAMRQPWILHLASTVERLHRFILERTLPPAILVAVRTELRWLARHGPDGLRRPAMDLLSSIPTSPDNELARALHGGPADPSVISEVSDWRAAQESLFRDVMVALADWTDYEIATRIDALLSENEKVFGPDTGRSRPFIWTLVTDRPSVGEAICEQAMAAPERLPASLVAVALAAMGRAAGDRAVHWGRTLMNSMNTELTREVAQAFGNQRGRGDLLGGEGELLRALAAHEDTIVRRAALGAVHAIAAQHKDLAIELLTTSPAVETADLDTFAMAIAGPPFSALSWSDLSQDQQKAFLTALATASAVDSYEIGRFLAELVSTEPLTVIELLEARVESSPRQATGMYSPLPFHWDVTPPFREHDDFPALLRQIRDWIAAEPESTHRRFWGANLFELVAGPYDARVTEVIDEYFHDSDPVKISIAADILSKAHRTIVWDVDFVRSSLRAADRHGDASLERVRDALHAATISGMRSGTPGQPYPEDVEQHAKATELADKCARGSVEEQFYRGLAASAQHRVQQKTDELPPDGRAW